MFKLQGSITVRMRLPPNTAHVPPVGVTVRELLRAEVSALGGGAGLPTIDRLDAIAPRGWRCFAAFVREEAIHHSFVAQRDEGPVLFRVFTAEGQRRRGVFRAVVSSIAFALYAEGEPALYSRIGLRNRQSLRAHERAGFAVLKRRYDPILLGVDLRLVASRVVRRLRGRTRAELKRCA